MFVLKVIISPFALRFIPQPLLTQQALAARLADYATTVDPFNISEYEITALVNEFCEMNLDGVEAKCTFRHSEVTSLTLDLQVPGETLNNFTVVH